MLCHVFSQVSAHGCKLGDVMAAPGHTGHREVSPAPDDFIASHVQRAGSSVFDQPSIEVARQRGIDSMAHRIPDSGQPTGYRLARPGETFDPVSLHQ